MCLSILNVGAGDTKLTFEPDQPAELERAKRIVTDMLKLGYAIMIKVGDVWRRATGFDPDYCEYLFQDVPAEAPALKARRNRTQRVKAHGTQATAVARSAGGMSDRADSVEFQNMERFDNFENFRNGLREVAELQGRWAGIPMPLEDLPLVVEPKYAGAAGLMEIGRQTPDEYDAACKPRASFYSTLRRADIIIWTDPNGKIEWGIRPAIHGFDHQLRTLGASDAWGIEQEANALQLLATLIRHRQFKQYLMTGSFLEKSERSGVSYCFRKLRPTVAIRQSQERLKILAVLCMHPIAYYAGSWSGAMCPTDDVIAHLMLMRGDECLYWRRCNQHRAYRPEAGL